MKVFSSTKSLSMRLVAVSAMLLFAQQSMAAGTRAGEIVSNQATVNYSVGTVAQTGIQSLAATFVVDNRVDFTIVANPNTPVLPTDVFVGDFDQVVEFIVENTGNEWQDYSFAPANLGVGADIDGFIDSGDMNNLRVIADNNGNNLPDDAENYIDELEPETTRLVWILADTDTAVPNELLDGDIANMELTATTNDGNDGTTGALGAVTVDSPTADDPDAIDVVLAVGGVQGVGSAATQNTYRVESADLEIVKSSAVTDDPFMATAPLGYMGPFRIPGATITYTIDVINSSASTAASDASIIDNIPAEMLVADGAVITLTNATIGGVAAASCTADVADANGDGCGIDSDTAPQVLNIGSGLLQFLAIPADTTVTAEFDLTIL
jgi:uncharacterized repeat protein (TIGR01451 family)